MPEQIPPQVEPASLESGPTLPEFSEVHPDNAEDITAILPRQIVTAEAVGQTDVGRDRHHNEDFFVIKHRLDYQSDPRQRVTSFKGLYILCDGMGGHAKGEVASALAAETLVEQLGSLETVNSACLETAILAANQAIYAANESKQGRTHQDRMGTTLVLCVIEDSQVHFAHVGDSRMYALTSSRGLEQLTVDHEVGQQEIQRGVDPAVAYRRPDAYQLTQAIGPRRDREVSPDINEFTITEDTLLLLCSDGLTDNGLLETHAATHLVPLLREEVELQQGVSQLVNLANQYNGHDNVTVLAIRIKAHPQPPSG
ncbi:MAG: serine/threonine phosphatase [Thermosynechococcaceae cyanobacterium]